MIMTVCTLLVCGYEWFLIFKVSAVVRVLEENLEQNKFQTSLFASMLMYKAKIQKIFLSFGLQFLYFMNLYWLNNNGKSTFKIELF